MAELENQQTSAQVPGEPAPHGDGNGIRSLSAHRAQTPSDSEDDCAVRGISIIPVPRREIARLQGMLRLSELPRHKPTIVFDAERQFQGPEDE